ncbi:MAG TPA: AAA family ATPase [Candidatus Limnocylindria bacterium]|nr:AAA family ATPase [Candidatus Limnocylindria bacterium]
MRIVRVVARAFGPFADRTLELAPGMTVVAGPNESGKSSWHAALRLAITGVRRGKGPGTAAERALGERHRPWDNPERWEVEARLQLDDGRAIDISQDLAAKVACRAVDVALGRDVSDEILDGTPDAARWLGLDRDSFASTVAVNQAQIVAVADAAESLQEQMQRAAATRGTDATAAEAIARLEQFRRDAVGADTVAAKGPLRTAKNRVTAADAAVALARQHHADYLAQSAGLEAAERAAETARVQLAGAEAARARMQAADFAARAARAAELAERYPAPPPSLAADDELAARVGAARDRFAHRPERVELGGPAADDLQRQLEALPTMPDGEIEPHPTVLDAQRAFLRAEQALELLGDEPPRPAITPDVDASRLRDLARRLEPRSLPEAAALEAELDRLRARPSHFSPTVAIAVGGIGVMVGALLAVASLGLVGAVVAAGAIVVALGIGLAGGGSNSAAVTQAEGALAPYREAAERAHQERVLALEEARTAGLPHDPAELSRLADELAASGAQLAAHEAWLERRGSLDANATAARDALRSALVARGFDVPPGVNPTHAAEEYVARCRAQAEQARAAQRAEVLRSQIEARRVAEDAAAAAAAREADSIAALRTAAAEIGIDADRDPEALAAALDQWRVQRAGALAAAQQALGEWQQLQTLLDGGTLDDLRDEASRRRQRANELAEGLPPAAITLPVGVDHEEFIAGLRRKVESLAQEQDLARGSLEARRSTLPDVAEAEEAAAAAHLELDRVQRLAATVDATLALLHAAQERVHRDLAPVLGQAVNRWLPAVSGGAYVEVSVDPGDLRVSVKEADSGQWRDARLLSEGTREQIYLLLRVAMAEHLVTTGERAPLLLDEVTAQADTQRKVQLLEVLHRLSAERQVILFTHDDEVLAWADGTLREPQDAVVRLQPVRGARATPMPISADTVAEPMAAIR